MDENENFDGLCDECGAEEASFTVMMVVGEQRTQRHLCPACMAKLNRDLAAGNVKQLLNAIMAAITGGESNEEEQETAELPAEDLVCERCMTSLSSFIRTGRLGCPGCYQAFEEQLTPMLQQLHGRVQHAGRKPLHAVADQRRRSVREDIARQMEQAVSVEDYETAAQLRDQLRALAEKEDE